MLKTFDVTPQEGIQLGPNGVSNLASEVVKSIKEYLSGGIFKSSTGRLRDSIIGYASGSVIHIRSNVSYAKGQNDGVASHVMWYLLGETVPVPTAGGVVYRKATLSSLLRGKWRHPGYPGKRFVQAGVSKVQNEYPEVTIREIQNNEE